MTLQCTGAKWMKLLAVGSLLIGSMGVTLGGQKNAQGLQSTQPTPHVPPASVEQWLEKLHRAAKEQAYVGTFVVSSANGVMHSSRIWHSCNTEQQFERVDVLTGQPRSTLRRNNEVITFYPASQQARVETRDSLGWFLSTHPPQGVRLDAFYSIQPQPADRVAGFDAEVVQVRARDAWRFGYRLWSEKQTGLLIKMQTVTAQGQVLEQMAFSELDLNASVDTRSMERMMTNTQGYEVQRVELQKTVPQQEGWTLKTPVPGFVQTSCHRRLPASDLSGASTLHNVLQWTFSDGLATVSLFIEPWDAQPPGQPPRQAVQMVMGATHTLSRRLDPQWWLTVMGEVPVHTLKAFADALQRTPAP